MALKSAAADADQRHQPFTDLQDLIPRLPPELPETDIRGRMTVQPGTHAVVECGDFKPAAALKHFLLGTLSAFMVSVYLYGGAFRQDYSCGMFVHPMPSATAAILF